MSAVRVVEVSLDETLKLLRAELKREFPGTKFRVTRDRGSAYGYVSVRWEDGPPMADVSAICAGYEGQRFDCSSDVMMPVRHLAADGSGELVQVRYLTRSILCSRSLSLPVWGMYLRLVLELDTESPLVGPYAREELIAMPDEELYRVTGGVLLGGEWLHGLAWRMSEMQEVPL